MPVPIASVSIMAEMTAPLVTGFLDPISSTFSYVVQDPGSNACAVIDPVMGFDIVSGTTDTKVADRLLAHIADAGLEARWILETHVHADHLSGAPYVKHRTGARTGIGRHINQVRAAFSRLFDLDHALSADGQPFDRLFDEGDTIDIGSLEARVLETPGHTPACITYVIGDAAFVGDTLFMPDAGTARCDFPGGDAATLYGSIQKILSLPDQTRLFICHDYAPGGRAHLNQTTVAEEKADNIHIRDGARKADFVAMRQARDATLALPTMIIPSLQVNIRAGELPRSEKDGAPYIKIPVNQF